MTMAKTTASTAALLFCSTALLAQEGQDFQNVYVDVEGSAILIPVDLAGEACALDPEALQQAAASRFDETGFDRAARNELFAPLDTTASTEAATEAGTGNAPTAIGAEGAAETQAATAEAAPATPAEGTADTGTATAEAGGAETTEPVAGAEGTTMTAGADASTEAGGQPMGAEPVTADASGGAAGQDAATAGEGSGDVQNVQTTAADTTDGGVTTNAQGSADATTATPGEDLVLLAVCQVDVVRAAELGIPTVANETVTD